MSLDFFVSHYNYWVVIFLMMVGFYILISRGNLIKKIVGLNIFQTAVFMLYISMGKITGGTPPILVDDPHGAQGHNGAESLHEGVAEVVYSNPLPHVLILTAIVVGIATTSVGSPWPCASRRRTGRWRGRDQPHRGGGGGGGVRARR